MDVCAIGCHARLVFHLCPTVTPTNAAISSALVLGRTGSPSYKFVHPGCTRGQPADSKSAKCCDARLSRPTRKEDPSSWALRFRVVRSRGWTSPFRFPQSHSSAMLGLLKHVALADRTGKARLRSLELGCTLPVPAFCPRRCTLSQPTETETSTPRFGQLRRAVRIVVEFVFSTSFPVSFPGCFS